MAADSLLFETNHNSCIKVSRRGRLEVTAAECVDSDIAVIAFVEDIVDTKIRSQRPVARRKFAAHAKIGYRISGH